MGVKQKGSDRTDAIRRFNRFYTKHVGALQGRLLDSPFSLTEARVLYELAQRDRTTAAELIDILGLDAGYLSRILRRFLLRKLISRTVSPADRRNYFLTLTEQGRAAFAPLDAASRAEVEGMLAGLTPSKQRDLMSAMVGIEQILTWHAPAKAYRLRAPRPGDFGWIIHRHGALYAQEYGWDQRFEALVAEIVSGFITHFDPRKERCWIAEQDGEIVGSVFLVKDSARVAKLRLLYLEPGARGQGIAQHLVKECVRFARSAGYRKLTLWTNDILHAARKIYVAMGFVLVKEERHHSFGHHLTGQYWSLDL